MQEKLDNLSYFLTNQKLPTLPVSVTKKKGILLNKSKELTYLLVLDDIG